MKFLPLEQAGLDGSLCGLSRKLLGTISWLDWSQVRVTRMCMNSSSGRRTRMHIFASFMKRLFSRLMAMSNLIDSAI